MKFMVIIFAIIVAISAKQCVEYGWNYAGYDIDIISKVPHWSNCANHCKNHKSCQYWSWQITAHPTWRYNCYLKTSKINRKWHSEIISGRYDCTSET